MTRTYRELVTIPIFEDRFRYLALGGKIGDPTFGGERFLNQEFYTSAQWRAARDIVMVRDNSCDLGVQDRVIQARLFVHHIEPITPDDFKYNRTCLLDPDNLISVSHRTHNAIHFGDESILDLDLVERTPDDHIGWKRSS